MALGGVGGDQVRAAHGSTFSRWASQSFPTLKTYGEQGGKPALGCAWKNSRVGGPGYTHLPGCAGRSQGSGPGGKGPPTYRRGRAGLGARSFMACTGRSSKTGLSLAAFPRPAFTEC